MRPLARRVRSMATEWFGLLMPLAMLLAGALHPGTAAAAIEITDDRGVVVRFEQPPRRIVSLLPSLTETLCEIGRCDRLVGVDRYANWPASVDRLPRLGGGIDPNVEAIVALRPDAVLLAQSSRVVQRLEALGLKVVVLEPRTHADVRSVLSRLARLTGVETAVAQRTWQGIDAAVSAAARSLPASAANTRVYFEVNRAPYGAGPSSFIGETLARLGVRNILPASLGPFPKLNPEFVVRADPDLIMVGERNAEGLADRPGWGAIRAVREGRMCVFSNAESDVLVRPGPRMAEAARIMARCLKEKAP